MFALVTFFQYDIKSPRKKKKQMSTYVIGDVHGCLDELKLLLDKIKFCQKLDTLYFVGDIINRGKDSLNTIQFIRSLSNAHVVLGNHELHLLALAEKVITRPADHPLQEILNAKNKIDIIEWVKQQPLIRAINNKDIIVHAGIPPQWGTELALILSNQACNHLQSNQCNKLLNSIYHGPKQIDWQSNLPTQKCLAYTLLALTHMRKCNHKGSLELNFNQTYSHQSDLLPWFEWPTRRKERIFFGHWASLRGQSSNPKCIATDTGCVYGHELSAYHLEQNRFIRVNTPHQTGK